MIVNRVDFIKQLCHGKDVLNLGCADATRLEYAVASGAHLHCELNKVARRLVGVDIDEKALRMLRAYVDSELICHSAERLHELSHLGTFDVVVAGELIEHLSNPGLMLDGAGGLLRKGGSIIVTTPNAFALKFFLHSAFRGVDPSSDHHTLLFSPKTLRELLTRHGFGSVEVFYSVWTLPSIRSRVYALLARPLFNIRPWLADTIIAKAIKTG